MKNKKNEWLKRMAIWRQQYGAMMPRGRYDPTTVRVPSNRCAKCGSYQSLTRHHMGHEYYLACILPDVYAARYIAFLPEDITVLCTKGKRCHQRIHVLYKPILKELWDYIQSCLKEFTYEDGVAVFHWNSYPDQQVLESFRQRMVRKCVMWLDRKNKKNPKTYRSHRDAANQ